MKKEEIIKRAKSLAERHLIDPYIPDVLSDGSTYADDFLAKLSTAETEDGLLKKIQEVMS
jgi:hypothetical protein